MENVFFIAWTKMMFEKLLSGRDPESLSSCAEVTVAAEVGVHVSAGEPPEVTLPLLWDVLAAPPRSSGQWQAGWLPPILLWWVQSVLSLLHPL